MIVLGLTGSIGMGKSTAAGMLRRLGCPVHDSDAAVHRLYAKGGAAVPVIAAAFPGAVKDGAVDRAALSSLVVHDHDAMNRLGHLVHPLVRGETRRFLYAAARRRAKVAVLDVPLLLEAGRAIVVDAVLVVSAPGFVQRQRVLARPGMSEAKLMAILGRQMPDPEKRRRADFVVATGLGKHHTLMKLKKVLKMLAGRRSKVWPPKRGSWFHA
jgi:dephospho-CoA kinase